MIVPAVEQIEMAIDETMKTNLDILTKERKELSNVSCQQIVQITPNACNADFVSGYLLGLQTMRVVLRGMPLAQANGIEL